VISLDRVVGVLLDVMPGRRDERLEHRRIDRRGRGRRPSSMSAGAEQVLDRELVEPDEAVPRAPADSTS
jgi:hypothetical protein